MKEEKNVKRGRDIFTGFRFPQWNVCLEDLKIFLKRGLQCESVLRRWPARLSAALHQSSDTELQRVWERALTESVLLRPSYGTQRRSVQSNNVSSFSLLK